MTSTIGVKWWAITASVLLVAACGGTVSVECGPGTTAVGGVCVATQTPNLQCGEGTVAVNGTVCLPRLREPGGEADTGEPDVSPTDDAESADVGGDEPDATNDEVSACVPDCAFRECGGDGCGGSCGTCDDPTAPTCDEDQGVCGGACVPSCYGKTCGPDGCGGTCGACGPGSVCHDESWCTPESWTCEPSYFADGSICDCECGAVDVDCAIAGVSTDGCDPLQVCDGQGLCVDKVPQEWVCDPYTYGAQDYCNCDCGAPDPDCESATAAVVGCEGQYDTCEAGACVACVASCDGKTCGSDGCGGSCGACGAGDVCHGGQCVNPCYPHPLACEGHECGDDGCGGTCGDCDAGTEVCMDGHCTAKSPVAADDSCYLQCQSYALSGCACYIGCEEDGTCCADYKAMCTCAPDCAGKQCGDNGCGGTCGTCDAATPYCTTAGQCTSECTPACEGKACGPDGCGGVCGECGSGETCSFLSQCVPADWHCPTTYYGDGSFCDCGCGAADPDCALGVDFTYGCPAGVKACTDGICAVDAFCSSKNGCADNKWCIGLYLSAPGQVSGVCGWPWPNSAVPGAPCESSEECSTGCCLGASCREHCGGDSDCPGAQRCLGFEVASEGSGTTLGLSGGCEVVGGSGSPCDTQSACPAGERCLAFLAPTGNAPRMLCSLTPGGIGTPCNAAPCKTGLLCAPSAAGGDVCALPCPGGVVDCHGGEQCLPALLSSRGTANSQDDIMVDVCTP